MKLFKIMERRQKAAKVKKTEKRRRDGQKGGKCRLNTAKGPPWFTMKGLSFKVSLHISENS
jgi:hypothetical protein